jgi:hypothetical protein
MNKRILLVLIPMVFLGLFGSSKISLAISEGTIVWLNPPLDRGAVGNDVSVNVMISDVANLHSWEFKLFYETNCLNAYSVTEGPFLKSFAGVSGTYFGIYQMNDAYNSTHGLVWAYCVMLGTPSQPATGGGVLATVKFRCSDSGTSHLALDYPGLTYPAKLKDTDSISIPCITSEGIDVLVVESVPLDISIDVGALYFPEEQVEWYIMTTYRGVSVTPTQINAILYNPDGESMSLVPQAISTGFYKATYTMPSDASSGTWAIVIEATYSADTFEAQGTSFKTYLLSSTLNSLQLHVTAIEGSTATIQTTLGTIEGRIISINGNIATIQTNIGIIKADISTVKANTTPKAVDWTTIGLDISLALLASIAVVLVVLYLYLRARFRSETVPS